jgi:hypothetical protein
MFAGNIHRLQTLKHPKYSYTTGTNGYVYRFTSVGPKGEIKKIVIYSKTQSENIYNLAFGNYTECDDDLDDLSVSNNHDTQKILATVASTLLNFMRNHRNAWVAAEGSTAARTRLYQIGISQNLMDIPEDFAIFGYNIFSRWEPFSKNKKYERFLITRKQNVQHYEN